ncbi:SDR family NAD(P)-dependent oxidoreductase [Methylocystis sp. H62]|uniref:SDR family NAD(P)-dependent oxidoreductase n=1 Tax=Methylocystis sp. H62 TaxID=2785789 RepID=UPI002896BDF4|nr:SDR family NAD(P)-dependent oxidoreductase [Methylocystis sp. H62]
MRPLSASFWRPSANLEARGANVVAIEADLSTIEGVDRLYDAAQQFGRPVDVLIANAGIGLGNAFLDRDFQKKVRDVIDQHHRNSLRDPKIAKQHRRMAKPGSARH